MAEVVGTSPKNTGVTVVGGHSGPTIVPLLSQTEWGKQVTGEAWKKLVHRIQFGGDEVVKAKDGAGSATLSMAYAGASFTNHLLRGLSGEKGVITPTFVKNPLYADQGIDFFSSPVELGVSLPLRPSTIIIDEHRCRLTVLRRFTLLVPSALMSRFFSRLAYPSSRRILRRARHSLLRGILLSFNEIYMTFSFHH